MKINVNNKPVIERKLVAVIGATGGLFIRSGSDKNHCVYMDEDGTIGPIAKYSLEHLANDSGRTPIYEGDSITLQF